MLGYILVGTLSAFGALSMLWAILGWLLPCGSGWALVCWGTPDTGMVSRYRWLTGAGLLRCPLIAVVSEEAIIWEPAERCSGESLLSRLEMERKEANGTGIGDSPGRH